MRYRLPAKHWKSADEEFAGQHSEFPEGADRRPDATTRRTFLKLLGASGALSGLAQCSQPPIEKILPYNVTPEGITPGVAVPYATSFVLDGHATGLLVLSHDGRPTKVEGNPDHPASLGAAGIFEQASVLGVYDPDRARSVLFARNPSSFDRFTASFDPLRAERTDRGAGLRLLLEPQSSPLWAELLDRFRRRYPEARITYYSAPATEHAQAGTEKVFGRKLQPLLRLGAARIIVALDSDFLSSGPMHLRHAREFAARRVPEARGGMNRLYVVEASLSPTGSAADHRLAVRSSDIAAIAGVLLAAVREQQRPEMPPSVENWVRRAAADLLAHRGEGLVIAGDRQPAEAHAAVAALNAELHNVGVTVSFIEPTLLEGDQPIEALTREMHAGRVDTLVMTDVNPVYSTPGDLSFRSALARVRTKVLSSLYANETAQYCDWFVPSAHYLESWGDARAYDGTVSFIQPLIRPLFGGKTPAEILAVFVGERRSTAHDLLIASSRRRPELRESRDAWERVLSAGFLPNTALSPQAVAVRADYRPNLPAARPGLELDFAPSPTLYDGRFANNVWLLELPSPITKLSWDNALLVGPKVAKDRGLESEDFVEVTYRGRKLEAPVLVVPGQASDSVTLHLGWGRSGGETRASVGVDANRLRTSDAPAFGTGLQLKKLERKYELALTQTHWSLEDRPHALSAEISELAEAVRLAQRQRRPLPSLLPEPPAAGPQWAMSIDLSKCFGCSACVIACQAENNVPTVGKKDVRRSREMYWLRIDTYYSGVPDAPDEVIHQPMLCQHCEQAPCEYVCPVFATTHSPDGLNEMVYNRCIGTRFCSNNCPYKVRRFNWFKYGSADLRQLQHNPSVTVRERGVMEKCTYCVQRIRTAGIERRVSGRPLDKAPLQTACQQACPARAITFGDVNDSASEVVRWRRDRRSYSVLHELGTRPRTQYLMRVKNPRKGAG